MNRTVYAPDNSAILYLALIRKKHTNIYRFTMTMTDPVDPDALQRAMDRVYRRFPTIIAGFRPGFFTHTVVPAEQSPQVLPDPGVLIPMTKQEIAACAFRLYYRDREISYEGFHAAADGFGAIAFLTTLTAEYLRLSKGIDIPVCNTLRDVNEEPKPEELEDSYLVHQSGEPLHLPSRYSYQLPGEYTEPRIYPTTRSYPIDQVLAAARSHGVSLTSMLTGVMASSIMEVQKRHRSKLLPVRIMVPADLRRMFKSTTLRNFILYALPTLEPEDHDQPLSELLRSFHRQTKAQLQPERMASIMAYNVKTQASLLYRMVPRALKCAFMRVAYKYFGESNSSITLTNLGNVVLPDEMDRHVEDLTLTMTPRTGSPYNCGVLAFKNKLKISICRFGPQPELEEVFFNKLDTVMNTKI